MKHSLSSKWRILFDKSQQWISFKPQPGMTVYPCYSCRTMFSSKLSFQDHINRRVIVIKFSCPDCSNSLTFYNRCSFILHARKHFSLQEGIINLSYVDIHLLPLGLAGFSRHQDIPFLYEEDDGYVSDSSPVNSQFYSPDEGDMGKQIATLKPYNLVFYYSSPNETESNVRLVLRQIGRKVPLCRFVTEEAEQQRLKRIQAIPPLMKIKREPIDDDDDGDDVSMAELETINVTQCPECLMLPKSSLSAHFLGHNKPLDEALTCYVCKFVAPTECSLKAHVRVHTNAPPFVCPECGVAFSKSETLLMHMEDVCYHLTKQIRYKCSATKCGKLFVLPKTYAVHFGNHIQPFKMCVVCNQTFTNDGDFTAHKTDNSHDCEPKIGYNCKLCKNITITDDTYREHIDWHILNRQRCVYIYACKLCRSHFRSTATYAVHKAKCAKFDRPQIRDATTTTTTSTTKCASCGHLLAFRDKDTFKTCPACCKKINCTSGYDDTSSTTTTTTKMCVLCNEKVSNEEKKTHLSICKYNNPVVEISRESDVVKEPSIDETKADNAPPKRKRKRLSLKSNRGTGGADTLETQTEDPLAMNDSYRCLLCNFKRFDRTEFHMHIVGHRNISTAYQCMECGECFVVKPSLEKHLLHYHKIANFEEYFQNNDCYNKSAIEELETQLKFGPGEYRGPLKENQCRVCLNEFDSALELDKHFRIHGMAYLMKKTK